MPQPNHRAPTRPRQAGERPGLAILRDLLRGVRIVLAVSLVGVLSLVLIDVNNSESVVFMPTEAELAVEHLVEEHGCWTASNAPQDVVPGHALVTLPGGVPEVVAGDVGFGIWLDGEPGVLHAFCK